MDISGNAIVIKAQMVHLDLLHFTVCKSYLVKGTPNKYLILFNDKPAEVLLTRTICFNISKIRQIAKGVATSIIPNINHINELNILHYMFMNFHKVFKEEIRITLNGF